MHEQDLSITTDNLRRLPTSLDRIRQLQAEEKFDDALALCTAAIDESSGDVSAWAGWLIERSRIYMQSGNPTAELVDLYNARDLLIPASIDPEDKSDAQRFAEIEERIKTLEARQTEVAHKPTDEQSLSA